MSAASSDDWDAVDDEDVPGYSAKAQAQKIEYELEARRKLEQKQFPLRVVATGDDSSSQETGVETVPTSNLGGRNMKTDGMMNNNNTDLEDPSVVGGILLHHEAGMTTLDQEEDLLLETMEEEPPEPTTTATTTTTEVPVKLLQVETVMTDDTATAGEKISPLANIPPTKETIDQQTNNPYYASSAARNSHFHFTTTTTTNSYPPTTISTTGFSGGALTIAGGGSSITSKEPSPVESRFGVSPAPSFPSPKTRLQFSPLALPPPNSDGFAQVLKERTRQRRAQEDAAVSSLRAQVNRLEAALAMESKRRVSSIRSLHEQSMQAAQELQDRLKKHMQDEIALVSSRLERMEERMAALEARYHQDMENLQHQMKHDSEQMQSQLSALQTQFTHEEQQRKVRHQQQLDQIQTVADEYLERWKEERQERLTSVQELLETMDTVHSSREQNIATFEGQLTFELQQLQLALTEETGERQLRDQEIVHALNQYVQQLQESLAAAVTRGSVY